MNLNPHRILYIIILICSLFNVAYEHERISFFKSVSMFSMTKKIVDKGLALCKLADGSIISISLGKKVPDFFRIIYVNCLIIWISLNILTQSYSVLHAFLMNLIATSYPDFLHLAYITEPNDPDPSFLTIVYSFLTSSHASHN